MNTIQTLDLRLMLVVLVAVSGCVPSAGKTSKLEDRTVEELFACWSEAQTQRDWATWFECMTPEARESQATGLLFSAPLVVSFAKSKAEGSVSQNSGELDAWITEAERLLQTADENDRFVLEMMTHLDRRENPRGMDHMDEERTLEITERSADRAKGKVKKDGRSSGQIWFTRINGRWRIELTLGGT
ncbi:hypothetical protein Poly51_60790 [Rubripirellula tenax]|uniref:Uncharacterized protein n=1 Tax=Rubripirellula tenax TaxID=2528015 RepID=A0A5C6E4D6_9BACT|nr:hypothetical protein [Rubripirellula tenax]TWU44513.1 hypothetical protein Poly51_60790 [Rubripirellula tenax]